MICRYVYKTMAKRAVASAKELVSSSQMSEALKMAVTHSRSQILRFWRTCFRRKEKKRGALGTRMAVTKSKMVACAEAFLRHFIILSCVYTTSEEKEVQTVLNARQC